MNSEPLKCYFPTESNPPTKYDLRVAQWLSRKVLDVSEVVVVVGKSSDGSITPQQKYDAWQCYIKEVHGSPISVYKDEERSPVMAIYNLQEPNHKDAFTIALPEIAAKNEQFQRAFEMFINYQVIITPPYDRKVHKQMLEALNAGSYKDVCTYLPPELSKEEKRQVYEILKPNKVEEGTPVATKEFWHKTMNEVYSRYNLDIKSKL